MKTPTCLPIQWVHFPAVYSWCWLYFCGSGCLSVDGTLNYIERVWSRHHGIFFVENCALSSWYSSPRSVRGSLYKSDIFLKLCLGYSAGTPIQLLEASEVLSFDETNAPINQVRVASHFSVFWLSRRVIETRSSVTWGIVDLACSTVHGIWKQRALNILEKTVSRHIFEAFLTIKSVIRVLLFLTPRTSVHLQKLACH